MIRRAYAAGLRRLLVAVVRARVWLEWIEPRILRRIHRISGRRP